MPNNSGTVWGIKNPYSIKDFYKFYKSTTNKPVKSSVYGKVLRDCNQLFIDEVVDSGREMRIPYLSTMQIRKKKSIIVKRLNYKDLVLEKVDSEQCLNSTIGFKARLYWNKHLKPIVGKNAYSFKLARDNQRRIRKIMQDPHGHVIYIEKNGY